MLDVKLTLLTDMNRMGLFAIQIRQIDSFEHMLCRNFGGSANGGVSSCDLSFNCCNK